MEAQINPASICGLMASGLVVGTVVTMTLFDYLLNAALVGLVLVQLRGRRLDRRGLLLPLMLVGWAASQYLRSVPTAGGDGVLVACGIAAGLVLGTASARLTRLSAGSDGVPVARATVGAALLWMLGIGARMGFSLYVQNGGRPTVARFSQEHGLTGAGWVSALVLMALVEVAGRTLILWVRSRELVAARPALAVG